MTLRRTGPAMSSLMALVAMQGLSTRSAADPTPKASSPIDLHHGVIVVACSPSVSEQAWSLAGRLYRDAMLRPVSADEQTVRVLAGDAVSADAPASVQDLARARTALDPQTPASLRVADSVSRELRVSALLLVHEVAPGYVRARLYRSAERSFYPIDLWPAPDGQGRPSWDSAVTWLHANAEAARNRTVASGTQGGVMRSGWFWGALGAAAGAAVIVYAAGRNDDSASPSSIHLNGRVGP